MFQAYVEYDIEILIEDYIVKTISFNVVISGTTSFLVDAANIFGRIALKKNRESELEHGKHMNYSGERFVGSNKVIKCFCSRNHSTD